MRIKILLDNDLATDGFIVFYLIYDNLTPFFEADTDKSTTPTPLFKEFAIWGSASEAVSRVNGSRNYSLTLDDLNLPAPEAR